MNDEKWNNVLIEWVNCLKLCKSIGGIDELRNGEFFSSLRKIITKSRIGQLDLLTFIFDLFAKHYPNFSFENKTEIHLSDLPICDLKSVTSLLMHYTCIYDRKDILTSPLCHSLSQTTQLIIRNFLQKVTKEVTNETMNGIIRSCIDDASDHLMNQRWLSVETSLNKNSPLQDLLKTPVSKIGRFHEKDKIISSLKSELELERYEKAEAQEELKLQLEKNKRIEQQLSQKNSEISRLRVEVVSLENRTPPHYQDMDSRELQRRLRAEIQSMEQYIKQIEEEQEEIRKEKDSLGEQLRKVERQSSIWEEKFLETERNFESLNEHAKKQEEELRELQMHCSEVTALLEEYKSKPSNESSLYDTFTLTNSGNDLPDTPSCEDLACSVVEVQLRDAQKQNEELKMQIQQFEENMVQLKNNVVETEEKLKKSEKFNDELNCKVKTLEIDKETIQQRLAQVEREFLEAGQKLRNVIGEMKNTTLALQEKSEYVQEITREKENLALEVEHLQLLNENIEEKHFEASNNWEMEKKSCQSLKNELYELRVVSQKLQFELADAMLNYQKVNSELDGLKIENEMLVKDLTETETSRKHFEFRMNECLKSVNDLKTERDCLQRENRTIKERISTIEVLLSIAEAEKVELILSLRQQSETLKIFEKTNHQLSMDVTNFQRQLNESLQIIGSNERYIKQLETNEALLKKELGEVQASLKNLKDAYVTLQSDKQIIHHKLNENEENSKLLREEKLQLCAQLQEVRESCCVLKNKNEESFLNNDILQKELESAVNCLEISKMKVEKLTVDQSSLKTQIEESKAISEILRKELEQTRVENQKINKALKEREADLQQSEKLCDNFKKENEYLIVSIEGLQKESKLSRDNITVLEAKLIEADINSERLRNDLDKTEQENCQLMIKLAESREQSKNVEHEKMAVISKLKDSEDKYHDLDEKRSNQIISLQEQLTSVLDALKVSKEESSSLMKFKIENEMRLEKNHVHTDKLKSDFENLQMENQNLNECLSELRDDVVLLAGEKDTLVQKLDDLKKENENLRELIKNLTGRLTAVVNDLESSEVQSKALRERNIDLETQLDQISALSVNLKLEIEEIEIKHKGSREKCVELNTENKNLENQLQDLLAIKNSNDALSLENKCLQQRIDELMCSNEQTVLENQRYKDSLEEHLKEKHEAESVVLKEKNTLIKELLKLKQYSQQIEKDNETLISENETLQKQLHDIKISKKQTLQDFRSTKESLHELLLEKQGMESKMKGYIEENGTVRQQNETLNCQLCTLETDNKELKNNKEIIERKLNEVSVLSDTLKVQSKEIRFEYQQCKVELEKAKIAVAELTDEKQNLTILLKEADAKNEALWKDISEKTRDLKINEQKLIEMEKKEMFMRESLNRLENENQTLTSNTKLLQQQISKIETESRESRNLLEAEVSKQASLLSDYTNELEITTKRILELENKETETLDKLQNENQIAISRNCMLKQRIVDIENESKEKRDLIQAEICTLTSSVSHYKDELNNTIKRAEIAELNCERSKKEVAALSQKLKKLSEQNSALEKQIEIEEIITSQNQERVKSLEEIVQDYEITISGLRKVVDTNLERQEILEEELSRKTDQEIAMIKFVTELLQENNVLCTEEGQGDFKVFISENVMKILKAKCEKEKRVVDLETEILELKVKISNLNDSFEEKVEKLQCLVMEKSDIKSAQSLKSSFDEIHAKVQRVLQNNEELSQNLRKAENDHSELNKQIEAFRLEREMAREVKIELESNLKEEKEKTENLRKELGNKPKSGKLEKENILGVSTKSNKSREEELKKENALLKRKLVLTENAKNNLEKILKELREEKKKTGAIPSPASNDLLYEKLLQEYIHVKEDHERIIKEKDDKIDALTRENEQIKMNSVQIKTEDEKKLTQDLHNIREAYGNMMSVNSKLELENISLRKVIEGRNSEMADLQHIREAYEKLLEENNKAMTEIDTVKYKRMRDKEEFVRLLKKEREENANRETKLVQNIRGEYEGKLEKMKEKMLKLYREEVNKKVKSGKDDQNESAHLSKTIANLESKLFEANQKIHFLEMEKEMIKANKKFTVETRSVEIQPTFSITSTLTNDEKATTLPRSTNTKEILFPQRISFGGISNCIAPQNLQMEDEEDLFNDKYLTDLKEGRCTLPADRESTSRFSELAWRNSMVPPHLKSSYPAEMQFISPTRFKDEDIKAGNIEFEDSLCKLLPGEKPRKKDFGTTSYKRPGPPTPSKNGGRLSLQGNEVHPMRELCETKTPKRSTPSRIKALFTGRNSSTRDGSDSQSNVTPSRSRRLSIFRRPR